MATFTYQPRNLLEDEMRFAMNVERMRDAAEQRQSRREAESRREQLFQLSLADAKRKNEIAARNHAFTLDNLDKAQQLARIKTDNALAAARDAQNLLAYQERDYDPLAEGLGTLRTGEKNFSQLPADQKEAVTMHFGEHGAVDGSGTVMDDDTVRSFALNPDASGKFDRFQGLRNREWRGALTSSASAGVGKKGNKTGKTSAGDFSLYADLFTPTYNRLLAENMIPKGVDRKETMQTAAVIYAGGNGQLSPERAMYRALGLPEVMVGGEYRHVKDAKNIYGKQFDNLDDTEKRDLVNLLQDFSRQFADINTMRKNGELDDTQYLYALRELDKSWTNEDFASPVRDEIHNLEYAELVKELDAKEKAISAKHPRRYKWVKDNPGVAHDGIKIDKYLGPTAQEKGRLVRYETGPQGTAVPIYEADVDYGDFKQQLFKIDAIRKALLDRERWIAQNANKRKVGK